MKWKRVTIFLRLVSLLFGTGGLTAAWYLREISASGIEDVPPPFILLAGIVGLVFLCVALIGRYPKPDTEK